MNTGEGSGSAARPMVSVVMPSYNVARFVDEAIESVLGQTHADLELIVVDDGSSDETVDVVRRYAPPVQLVTLAHTGMPGLVRNRGLERATGQLIAFLDADDAWMKEKLEMQVEYLRRHPEVDLVHTNLEMIDEAGRYLRDAYLGGPGSQGLSDDYEDNSFTQLMRGDSGVWTSSVLLRRECLDRVGLFDEPLAVAEDWHLWIRVARHARIGYLPEPLAKHRRHSTNVGMFWVPRDRLPEVELWTKIMALYPDVQREWGDVIRAKCAFHYVLTSARCVKRGYYLHAAGMLGRLLTFHLGRRGLAEFLRICLKFARRQWRQRNSETASLARNPDTPRDRT